MSNSSAVPRYDRLQDIRNGRLRFAEWYYGPQTRWLAAYELNISSPGFFNQFRVNLHYQNINESRNQREYRRYDRFDSRSEQLDIFGFIIDARKKWNNNEITIGADGQLNDVSSTASRTNLLNNTVSALDSRYPNGKNSMNYFGLYAQHLLKIWDEKIIVNDGLRINGVFLNSSIADNSFFNLPFTEISQKNLAVTGNLGMIYLPSEKFRVAVGFSSGFRNPNIDDLARVFESSTALKRVIIPSPEIKPEYTYNFDLGLTQVVSKKIKFEITGFYTLFRNAIGLAPFQLNGQDSIIYDGVFSAVFANRNVKKAYTYGFNSTITINLTKQLSLFATVTYTFGRFINSDGSKIPQDHIPPVFGKSGLKYEQPEFESEIYTLYNGWKRIKNYNLDGEDNQQYATPDGMPAWFIFNWRNSFTISKKSKIQFAVENILDRNYRYFASGFSASGRNYVFAFRTLF
jgi:hemoglobin/transferrin/lactoferrin receptor protein